MAILNKIEDFLDIYLHHLWYPEQVTVEGVGATLRECRAVGGTLCRAVGGSSSGAEIISLSPVLLLLS